MVFLKYIFIIGFHIRPDFESCVGRFQITHWFSIPQVIHQVGEADTPKLKDLNPQHETDTQRVVVHTWCMKLEDHLPDYEYVQSTTDFWPTIWVHRFQPPFCLNCFEVGFFSPQAYISLYMFKHALDIIVWVKTASRAILPLYFFPQRYCSSCRTTRQQQLSVSQMEKQDEQKERNWIEQENLWPQDKLLTSTYNTGPDGFVYVNLKTNETAEKQTSQRRKHT